MRVAELILYHVRIPLKRTIRHASHVRRDTENLIVRCRLETGEVGYGEGVPREYVTGEALDATWSRLKAHPWSADLSEDQTGFPGVLDQLAKLRLNADDDPRQCRFNAGRCAVELSLLDAYGQAFGQPWRRIVEDRFPDLFSQRAKVQYSGAITSADGLKLRWAALAMRLYGFKDLKVKVGIQGQHDVDRLRTIRNIVGPKMQVRIDVNEAWRPDEVVQRIHELEPFGICAVEQPVAHEHVQCLKDVRQQVKTPIMLDESLCSLVDAQAAARDETCDLFNLRLSKCGGLLPTLALAQFALRHGIGYQLGCQVGETAILSAAGRHFAAACKQVRWCEGSYDKRLVKESLARRDISFAYGGWAPALPGDGLGVLIDSAALERVTLRREAIYVR
jgi:L-alanine-DL-glutamate epimerase-like enolase superfamily enzyme